MPLYEYECEACGHRLEIIQKYSDGPPDACPKCSKGPLTRLLSSPAIQFKGTGWYITDYAQKGKSGGASTGSSTGSSKGESKSETTSADSGSSGESKKADAPASTPPVSKD